MRCDQCGARNGKNAQFCSRCGAEISALPHEAAQTPKAPMKRKTALLIGLAALGCLLIAGAAVLLISLAGGASVVGRWYSLDAGQILEFGEGSAVTITTRGTACDAEYFYDRGSGSGVVYFDGKAFEMEVANDKIMILSAGGENIILKRMPGDMDAASVFANADPSGTPAPTAAATPTTTPALTPAVSASAEPTPSPSPPATAKPSASSAPASAKPSASPSPSPKTSSIVVLPPKVSFDIGDKFPPKGSMDEILGMWYDSLGDLGTFEFLDNGLFIHISNGTFYGGTYTYDVSTHKGAIKNGDSDKVANTIEVKDGKLVFGGSFPVYVREYVPQSGG